MSTRCNVIIIAENNEVINYYRHDDGYPEWTGKELKSFCLETNWNRNDLIDKLKSQISDYNKRPYYQFYSNDLDVQTDLNYVYVIHLYNRTITAYKVRPNHYHANLRFVVNEALTTIPIH